MNILSRRIAASLTATAVAIAMLAIAASSATASGPVWELHSAANSTAAPGSSFEYILRVTNHAESADGSEYHLTLELPPGLSVEAVQPAQPFLWDCSTTAIGSDLATCFGSVPIPAVPIEKQEVMLGLTTIRVAVAVAPGTEGVRTATLTMSGGGASEASSLFDPTLITTVPPHFGIAAFDGSITAGSGDALPDAATHPDQIVTEVELSSHNDPFEGPVSAVEPPKDIHVDLPPGLVGDPTAIGRCSLADLAGVGDGPICPISSQVGTARITSGNGNEIEVALYNMVPTGRTPARFAFNFLNTIVTLDANLRSGPDTDYGLTVSAINASEAIGVTGVRTVFWGIPADPAHDPYRACPGKPFFGCTADANTTPVPFLRAPTRCVAPGEDQMRLRASSYHSPDHFQTAAFTWHAAPHYPAPPELQGPALGIGGCDDVPFEPELAAKPTAPSASTPTGLTVHVEAPNPGLENPEGISSADVKKTTVTLPEGVTINPSQAEGLGVCTPSQYAAEQLDTPFGEGCPADSKIGNVEIHSQLLEETVSGSLFIAEPHNNPSNSLLALYIVARNTERGVLLKFPGKVETDKENGRIVTTFDDLPQLPFETFDLKFREGARAPLVTPDACGTYETKVDFVPWSAEDPDNPKPTEIRHTPSSFQVSSGVGGGPCPQGGVPPFEPGFQAGSLNNNAGSFSPFNMRLLRSDGEQDMTKFSAVLPPGVVARIAGTSKCSDAAIAQAKNRTGMQELASPSCPASSQIGKILAGAGVGSVLTYVPGKLYLAGPFAGAPLSVVAITSAVAGPFDVGVVVNRQALTLNPRTGQVNVDGERSDPIPHILEGIPLKVRDVRIYVDKPNFTLNPTSCDPFEVKGELWGSFLDPLDPRDDRAIDLATRFQAANCLNLGFKPRLSLKLKGGTGRGGHPGLRAVLRPRPGDANLADTVVKLPRSAFLDQAHIRTVCTRVQFAANGGNGAGCPKGAIYGHVKAFTPLLDEPLSGPAYLRSSNHKLPDLVFALHGLVDIEAVGRIDSVSGGIRASFEGLPDAPLSKAIIDMQGAKKGLIVNSRNLCGGTNRAAVELEGQNGKARNSRPVVRAGCGARTP